MARALARYPPHSKGYPFLILPEAREPGSIPTPLKDVSISDVPVYMESDGLAHFQYLPRARDPGSVPNTLRVGVMDDSPPYLQVLAGSAEKARAGVNVYVYSELFGSGRHCRPNGTQL